MNIHYSNELNQSCVILDGRYSIQQQKIQTKYLTYKNTHTQTQIHTHTLKYV